MKKIISVLFVLMFMMTLCGCSTKTETVEVEKEVLVNVVEDYETNPTKYRSINLDNFSSDASAAPSDEDLGRVLHFAMASASAHGLTPAHYIVIRDVEEQDKIISGVKQFGLPVPVSEGTVTVLILGDCIRDEEVHDADYNGWYSQMYYGVYDTGASAAYLALAAQSLGYDVHQIAGLNIPLEETGEVNIGNGGRFDILNGTYWDANKYMSSKDGSVDFAHTVANGLPTGQSIEVACKDNLTLLSTMVIGKRASDGEAGCTTVVSDDLANYNFWDPQDAASYGKTYAKSPLETVVISEVADGTYSGSTNLEDKEYGVSVEVKDGKLVSIELSNPQNEGVSAYVDAMIENQALEVDAVAGATMECSAISEAVANALVK